MPAQRPGAVGGHVSILLLRFVQIELVSHGYVVHREFQSFSWDSERRDHKCVVVHIHATPFQSFSWDSATTVSWFPLIENEDDFNPSLEIRWRTRCSWYRRSGGFQSFSWDSAEVHRLQVVLYGDEVSILLLRFTKYEVEYVWVKLLFQSFSWDSRQEGIYRRGGRYYSFNPSLEILIYHARIWRGC